MNAFTQRYLSIYLFNIIIDYITLSINKIQWRSGQKHIHHFSMKGSIVIIKNCNAITSTATAAKVYNNILLNRIQPEIEKKS